MYSSALLDNVINVFRNLTIMFSPLPLWSRSRSCRSTSLSSILCRRQTRQLRTIRPSNTPNNSGYSRWSKTSSWIFYPTCVAILGAACFVTYQTSQPFRHGVLALVRCSRVAGELLLFYHQVQNLM